MKAKLSISHSVKKLNQTVFSILIVAFFLDFIPNIFAAIALVGNLKILDFVINLKSCFSFSKSNLPVISAPTVTP